MPRCEDCNITLSPLAHKRHVERDHALDRCPICARPVINYIWTPNGSAFAHYCSQECQAEGLERPLCWRCIKPYEPHPHTMLCPDCRGEYRKIADARRGFEKERNRIHDHLSAFTRARYLPKPYRRSTRAS